MSSEIVAIEKFYDHYLDTFHGGDAKALVAFYHTPCLFVTVDGVTLLSDEMQVQQSFEQVIQGLKLKDYDHSTVSDVQIRLLGQKTAMFSGLGVRYTRDGAELERLGATYTLQRVNTAWKFVTLVAHASDTLLRFA